MTLCILLINKKSLKPSILNGFQAFYSQKVSKTEYNVPYSLDTLGFQNPYHRTLGF
jgi:hypothetical protein